jgi:hypothetical protein
MSSVFAPFGSMGGNVAEGRFPNRPFLFLAMKFGGWETAAS